MDNEPVCLFLSGESDLSGDRLKKYLASPLSVFESMRTYDGKIFKLDEHLKRLRASCQTSGVALAAGDQELKGLLKKACKLRKKDDLFLRLTITDDDVFVIVSQKSYPDEVFTKGVVLRTSPVQKSRTNAAYPEAKTSSYAPQILASTEPGQEAFEILFKGSEGYIREASVSNVFMIKGLRCMTPPPVEILKGLTRDYLLSLAQEVGLKAEEVFFTRHDLFNADEVFLSNTSGELIPVIELDGRTIGEGKPGPWFKRLKQLFLQRRRTEQ